MLKTCLRHILKIIVLKTNFGIIFTQNMLGAFSLCILMCKGKKTHMQCKQIKKWE